MPQVTHEQLQLARRRMLEAHSVLEEYLKPEHSAAIDERLFMLLSAKMEVSTREYLATVANYLKNKYEWTKDQVSDSAA
jgi:hypothetical protein